MNLSDDQKKMEIVSRLVKEGHIDFAEAVKLLEENPLPVVSIPWIHTQQPYAQPYPYPQVWYTSDGLGNTMVHNSHSSQIN